MSLKYLFFVALLCVTFATIDGRIFNRCSLANELKALGVPRGQIPSWVCIAQYESSFNTAAVSPFDPDGSRSWGLFQINDRYWCDPQDGRPTSNACRVRCSELTTDNIRLSLKCSQVVKGAQGFTAWSVWNNRCQGGRALPYVDDCF